MLKNNEYINDLESERLFLEKTYSRVLISKQYDDIIKIGINTKNDTNILNSNIYIDNDGVHQINIDSFSGENDVHVEPPSEPDVNEINNEYELDSTINNYNVNYNIINNFNDNNAIIIGSNNIENSSKNQNEEQNKEQSLEEKEADGVDKKLIEIVNLDEDESTIVKDEFIPKSLKLLRKFYKMQELMKHIYAIKEAENFELNNKGWHRARYNIENPTVLDKMPQLIKALVQNTVTMINKNYYDIDSKSEIRDFLTEYADDNITQITIYNAPIANLMMNYQDNQGNILKLCKQSIGTRYYEEFDNYVDYLPVLKYFTHHLEEFVMKPEKKGLKVIINEDYKILHELNVITKDALYIIVHINKLFSQIKDKLVLDDKSMFYLYNGVPLICRHIYMQLDGKSGFEVSVECSYKNTCKYCGEPLESRDMLDSAEMPTTVANFVFMLLKAFHAGDEHSRNFEDFVMDADQYVNQGYADQDVDFKIQDKDKVGKIKIISNNTIFLYIYNKLCLFINQFCSRGAEDYDNKVTCLAAAFTWKVLKDANVQIKEYISDIENTLIKRNYSLTMLEKIGSKITNTSEIIDVLLNGFHQSYMNDPLVETFKMVKDKMEGLNFDDLKKELKYYYDKEIKIEDWNPTDKVTFSEVKIELNYEYVDNTDLYKVYTKFFCPVQILHEFDKSEICKHCGLKKDLSNVKECYKKYEKNFNTRCLIETKTKTGELVNKTKYVNISDIIKSGEDWKDYILKEFKLNEQKLESDIKKINCGYLIDIRSDIEIALKQSLNPNLTIEDIIKISVYLHKKDINKNILGDLLYTELNE